MLSEALLALRPTNVMHQLDADSRVPLFSGRMLLGGLAGRPTVLWMPCLPHPSAALGVLRAAVHLRSVTGFCLGADGVEPLQFRHQALPGGLFNAAARAADQFEQAPPFVLHVQAPPVREVDSPEGAAVRDLLVDCLQAGFTSFGVDLTACEDGRHAELAAMLLQPVLDLELLVAVRLPVEVGQPDEPGEQDTSSRAATVAGFVDALKGTGISPDLVILPGPEQLGDEAWRLAVETAKSIAPIDPAWPDPGAGLGAWPDDPAAAPVRAVVGEHLLRGRSAPGADPGADPERTEALAYSEAFARIDKLGGRGSVDPVLRYMVAQCE